MIFPAKLCVGGHSGPTVIQRCPSEIMDQAMELRGLKKA